MKYLGIDYGSKKIGLAISDDGGGFAFPHSIIKSDKHSINSIIQVIKDESINTVVIGESVNDKGQPNAVDSKIKSFAKDLQNKYLEDCGKSIQVSFEKEWYSSIEARRYDDKYEVDDKAAAIILQRYLDKHRGRVSMD